MDRFEDETAYVISGSALNSIWRDCYEILINDGVPLKPNQRRDIAQRLGALLEQNTEAWPAETWPR
jgi:hypothetical protein